MDAIVMSGGHRNVELRLGHPTKSMIGYSWYSSLEDVMAAVVGSDHVHTVTVIGPEESRAMVEKWQTGRKPVFWTESPAGFSMFQNLVHAYQHLLDASGNPDEREIFYTCSDVPFLTSGIVTDFIGRYEGSGLTATAPIVSLSACRDVEARLGKKIPSVADHLPIALDGELYHLANVGLLKPDGLSEYWLKALCLSRDARELSHSVFALVSPKRVRLLSHLFFGFLKQNPSKDLSQFAKFVYQLLNWVASSIFFDRGNEGRARKLASKVDSRFLFTEFFPSFGLEVRLPRYDRPEVFLDFDTPTDVEFLHENYESLRRALA